MLFVPILFFLIASVGTGSGFFTLMCITDDMMAWIFMTLPRMVLHTDTEFGTRFVPWFNMKGKLLCRSLIKWTFLYRLCLFIGYVKSPEIRVGFLWDFFVFIPLQPKCICKYLGKLKLVSLHNFRGTPEHILNYYVLFLYFRAKWYQAYKQI
jgi:hypothetical protein